MQDKEKRLIKSNRPLTDKRIAALIVVVIIAIILAVIFFAQQPERSVASYCKTFKEEKARLAKLPGDTYPSGVFQDELSDAGAFADAFGKLEKVAPDEIRPDVKTLQGIYRKMSDDPSQAIAASLSGTGAEQGVKKWTELNCK